MKKIIFFLIVFLWFLFPNSTFAAFDPNTYSYQKETISAVSGSAVPQLQQKLNNEVTAIMNAGGRLQPFYMTLGLTGYWLDFGYPGEEFLTLCDALPYVSDSTIQTNLKTYITNQLSQYPPYSYAYYPSLYGTFNPATPPRRERYPLSFSATYMNVWPPVTVPFGSMYVLWKCSDALNSYTFVNNNWTSIDNFYTRYTTSNQIDTYEKLLGLIGYIRLATATNHTTKVSDAITRMTNAAPILSDVKTTIINGQSKFLNTSTSNQDWTLPMFLASRSNRAYLALYGPEIGRFLKIESGAQTKSIFDILYSYMPQWYLFRGFYPLVGNADATGTHTWNGQDVAWLLGSGYSEDNALYPDVPWTMFMVQRDVYDTKGDQLLKYLDVPYTLRGDLYYIQRLTTTIKSYGTRCWVDIRNGSQTCEAGQKPGDINGDSQINGQDMKLILSNWLLGTSCSSFSCDINNDGKINAADAQVVFYNFGK